MQEQHLTGSQQYWLDKLKLRPVHRRELTGGDFAVLNRLVAFHLAKQAGDTYFYQQTVDELKCQSPSFVF